MTTYGAEATNEFNRGYEHCQDVMRENSKHNGWTNYATWRVNLEMFDGWSLGDVWGYDDADPAEVNISELSETLKEYVEELLDEQSPSDGIANAWAYAFISDVNWYEIAEHLAEV